MADIVDDFITRLQHYIPDAPAEVWHQIEHDVRAEWGGTKPYVAKIGRTMRVRLVASGLMHGQTIAECFSQAGVSRRTGYRILSSK